MDALYTIILDLLNSLIPVGATLTDSFETFNSYIAYFLVLFLLFAVVCAIFYVPINLLKMAWGNKK